MKNHRIICLVTRLNHLLIDLIIINDLAAVGQCSEQRSGTGDGSEKLGENILDSWRSNQRRVRMPHRRAKLLTESTDRPKN